jgi:hypothetical protein
VPGTDLLGMAGSEAIESAIPVGEVLRLPMIPSVPSDVARMEEVAGRGEVTCRAAWKFGHSEVLSEVSNGREPYARGGV